MFGQIIYYLKKVMFTLLGLVLALYLFVILLTYTMNDPSWSHISSDMITVNNMGGVMGAWLSDFLYNFFGAGAWLLFVFLVYETLLIWWHHSSISWGLRLISYLFLLLSSSTLMMQVVILFKNITDKEIAAAGGIIGQGLSWRLGALITQNGALFFILILTAVTITFAFDIHWFNLVKRFTGEIEDNRNIIDDKASNALNENNDLTENSNLDSPIVEVKEQSNVKEVPDVINYESQISHQQLALDLPLQEYEISQSKKPYNFLNEFLEKTGINKAIKQDIDAKRIAQEQIRKDAEKKAQKERQKAQQKSNEATITEKNVTDNKIAKDDNNQASELPVPIKVEPSFAWNNLQVINELLDTDEIIQNKNQVPNEANIDDEPITHTSSINTKSEIDIFHHQSQNLSNHLSDADDEDNEPKLESVQNGINQDGYDVIVEEIPYYDSEPLYRQSLQNTTYDDKSKSNQDFMDMTPTNTPPVNPKEAPKVESEQLKKDEKQDKHTKTYDVSMPDVHQNKNAHQQDKFLSNKSRAMQTANYRKSLTPIPPLSLLDRPDPNRRPVYSRKELEELSELLEIKLQEFNVKAEVKHAILGPVVTRFEVELAAGVKASKVTGISRDLARSLSMPSLRVVEIIAGKPYIGIEVPNIRREMVHLIELLDTKEYRDPKVQVSMAMGKDIGGKPIITDLAKAPHMLVAGTTGSGKSILVNAMLLSMLLKYTPNELRLILIDPKQLELANYNDIPHLLTPVVTDMTEAASSLSWCVAEMERRYQLMSLLKVRKVSEFNKKVLNAEQAGQPIIDPLWHPNDSVSIDKAPKLKTLPLIVIVADEFADMIMQVGKQAEELITRLAQKSRAAGIHLMLATQRPSVDVITGLIKANIPMRAALRVNSKVDSRTILDSGGAEDMLGNGDMLFIGPGQIEPERIHGAYVSDNEVNRVCDAWRERGAPDYIDNMANNFALTAPDGGDDDNNNDLYDRAVAFILETRKPSASSLQRKFSIGYNKAARLIDEMESAGLVSPMDKSGRRELLV